MHLDPSVAAQGVRLVVLDAVDSTNSVALAGARAGDRGNIWITARQQRAGRGRRGRMWHSPPGNLYASLLMVDACASHCAPQLSFVAALALHDAVIELAPALSSRLQLKWPNDLLLDGAKVAGILVEGETLPAGSFAAVIGIGVDCAAHPAETSYPAIDFGAAGVDVKSDVLFAVLSRTMWTRLAQWEQGGNFAAIRTDWLARAARLGEPILLRAPNDVHGIFAGVDEHGRLLLRGAGGAIAAYAAADIATRLNLSPQAGRGRTAKRSG